MRSIRSDRPIDPATRELLRSVNFAMKALELPYFILGATARDILLTHVSGLSTQLATRDVDIGVAVKDWDELQSLAAKLVDEAGFVRDSKIVHRLYKDEIPLDVIPFDGVESPEHTIAWPPALDIVMNVAGYQDVFDAAVSVEIEDGFIVRVVSLPGLAILKLFAWTDRGASDPRDAMDLTILLTTYAEAGNDDRLYNDESDAMEAVEYDLRLAGARLLGRDARRIAAEKTLAQLIDVLRDGHRRQRLTTDMARARKGIEDAVAEADELLEQFRAGLEGE